MKSIILPLIALFTTLISAITISNSSDSLNITLDNLPEFINKSIVLENLAESQLAIESPPGDIADGAHTQGFDMMKFHHALYYGRELGYHGAGMTSCPGCCFQTRFNTRSIEFVYSAMFYYCIAYDKPKCDRNEHAWLFWYNGEGYPDLRRYGWDRRIRAYQCWTSEWPKKPA